jgi:hypothetical protein
VLCGSVATILKPLIEHPIYTVPIHAVPIHTILCHLHMLRDLAIVARSCNRLSVCGL